MKVIAIITEYNPFHKGHKYQIDKLRREFGEDTAIIAIMSGSFTQRGDLAIGDKVSRAKSAVLSGVNLVLELPFPYSMQSAELFAKSGVHIANSLGVVDILSFGSELGNVDTIEKIASNMETEEYKSKLKELIVQNKNKGTRYAEICEVAYNTCFKDDEIKNFFSANNILGIEYIKALKHFNSDIKVHTVKRKGAGYSDLFLENTEIQSATAIRQLLTDGDISALEYCPVSTKDVFFELLKEGHFPADAEKLSSSVISFLRLNPNLAQDVFDAQGGLYNRLRDKSFEANSISNLVSLSETKKYTTARIRRALWNSFFGVTSSEIKELPAYTQLLAMDAVGARILKSIKKVGNFPVITKPSSYDDFSPTVIKQKEISNRADSVWCMSLPSPLSGRFPLKFTPYVKK